MASAVLRPSKCRLRYQPVDTRDIWFFRIANQITLGKQWLTGSATFGSLHAIIREDVVSNSRTILKSPSGSFGVGRRLRQKLQGSAIEKIGEARKGGILMGNQKTKKCAHIPCLCDVRNGEQYCGEACRDAGSEDVEIACQCDHPACPLTFREFAPQSAADLAG
jgi:hypothetical protein